MSSGTEVLDWAAELPNVRVGEADFDLSTEVQALRQGDLGVGAVVSFVGTVRDWLADAGAARATLTLEHYPGMTERSIATILAQARQRFDVRALRAVHRVGPLQPGDQIVLVAVSSAHRHEAFQAAAFIMDWLKTQAPFWKKEAGADGAGQWVSAREADDAAAAQWGEPPSSGGA